MGTRLLICGSRDFTDGSLFRQVLENLPERFLPVDVVIEGGAKGADTMAREWAKFRGIELESYTANWNVYGKRAGYLRNREMLDKGEPDLVLAFFSKPDSRGTKMMVDLATMAGVETYRFGQFGG